MGPYLPTVSDLQTACDLYIEHAYRSAPPPRSVTDALSSIRAATHFDFAQLQLWEQDTATPPSRFALRLGNQRYPHMKLAIECRPDRLGYVFRVETHDQHLSGMDALRDWDKFEKIIQANAQIAMEIEQAWAQSGLPTMRIFAGCQSNSSAANLPL